MSELLTTGQMIDQLRVGQIAVDKLGNEIFMEKDNSLRTLPNLEIVTLTDFTMLSKWRILPIPNYVSFEKAMKSLKDGKRVSFTYKNESDLEETIFIEPHYGAKSSLRRDIDWIDLFNTKWTIEE